MSCLVPLLTAWCELCIYRMGLIQTPDQLKFSYLSIMEVNLNFLLSIFLFLLQGAKQLGLIDSIPDYEAPVAEVNQRNQKKQEKNLMLCLTREQMYVY